MNPLIGAHAEIGSLFGVQMLKVSTMARSKTPDFARLDDIDVYIQSTPLTEEEHKRLSAIIKANREKYKRSKARGSHAKAAKHIKAAKR